MPKAKPIVRPVYDRLAKFKKNSKGDLVYAGRFPTPSLASGSSEGLSYTGKSRSPYIGTQSDNGGLTDPYDANMKNRFEDTFRADKIAARTLITQIQLILSNAPTCKLDVPDAFAVADLRKQALATVMSSQEYRNMLQTIKNINRRVKLHERLIAAEVQKRVYGRAALGVVVKNGMPTDLKVFASKNLGQVFVNPDWTFKSVVYFDNLIEKQEFAAQDILYFTHHDFNITPDTFYYGSSEIEGIAHDSETNRIISEEDLKECAKGMWAGIATIRAPGITTQDGANSLLNAFDPGHYNFVNQDVQVDVHELKPQMEQLIKTREANDMRIGRSSGVPLPLLGYENITNRATMDSIMAVNKATMVEIERSLLQSQLEPQWYDTLCMNILQMDAEHFEAAQVRVVMEFAELIFDALGERAFTLFGLFDRECLTKADLLRELKLEQYIPALDSAEIKQRQALQDSIQGQKIARIQNQSNETFSTQESKTNTPRQGAPGTSLMGGMAMASAALDDKKHQLLDNLIEKTKRKK